jgi:nucleotide-binding universal stress UspA family protein
MPSWRRILCPVDFSDASRAALELALDLAELPQQGGPAEVTIFHAYMLPPPPTATRDVYDVNFEANITAGLAKMREEARRAHPRLEIKLDTLMAPPSDGVLEYARRTEPDLIVIGAHGRTAIGDMLLGSVAAKVSRKARPTVITVRPAREAR